MWHIYNDLRPRIVAIMAINRNLELIMNDEYEVLAYRYDLMLDMTFMVVDDGKWCLTIEGQDLDEGLKNRLLLLCQDYSRN